MGTEVTFIDSRNFKVVTIRGEELIGTLFVRPAETEKQRQDVIDVVTEAFDHTKNLAEAHSYVQMRACAPHLMGIMFRYTIKPSEALRIRLGARIREIREHRGMTARDLSFLTHIDPSNLSKIEQGKHAVGIDTLFKILYYLDADLQITEKEIPEYERYHRTLHFE